MANFRFELNEAGVRELLQSKRMSKVLEGYANDVLGRLPQGFGKTIGMTTQRAKVIVGTRSRSAAKDNLKNNTLLKALGQ